MKKIGIIIIVLIGVLAFSIPVLSRDKADHVTISDEYKKLDVKVKNAKIEVFPSDGGVTEIELTDKEKDHNLQTKVKGDTLEVEVKGKRFFQWISFDLFSAFSQPTLTIYLPEKEYDSLQVETDNGKVVMEHVMADEVFVETDNGEINLIEVHGSVITATADNGRINLDHVEGMIVGETDNGKISLETESLDQSIDLQTDNGVIEVWTEKEPSNNTFEIKTDNGPITVFGSSNYDTIIGEGKHLIKLHTDNGRVTVDRK